MNDLHDTLHERQVKNPSGNKTLTEVIEANLARRDFLKTGALAAASFPALGLSGCGTSPIQKVGVAYESIGIFRDDDIHVPEGYKAEVFYSWGDPISDGPEFNADGSNSSTDQEVQAGQNHDGMRFYPIPYGTENPAYGLLVMNHEYVNPTIHGDRDAFPVIKTPEQVAKEQAAHGVSIIEVARIDNQWQIVRPSLFARRITANTPMTISGPAAGDALMQTVDDTSGTSVLGTINNCAMGWTPWGTYLTCEENWKNYFVNTDEDDRSSRREHARYGVQSGTSSTYGWEVSDGRFDATPATGPLATAAYENEPNRFGWVVEIDPYDPDSTPIKRTAMGRLVRECATPSIASDRRVAFYMGDDGRGEYLYKFVTQFGYVPDDRVANATMLDNGTLYVARFNDDGSGEWLPILQSDAALSSDFTSQAEVLINARTAADLLGATTMDRPEWVAVNPDNRDVYVTLTNNSDRGQEGQEQVNAANPRASNQHGHIMRMIEAEGEPTATTFYWNIYTLAGDPSATEQNLQGNIDGDIFTSPDGAWFDDDGRLWIQTDFGDSDDPSDRNYNFGYNQMLGVDPHRGLFKRFFVGPKGCEVTGVTKNPDGTAMWVNVQHPTANFPADPEADPSSVLPRSSTVLITKLDGGVVGS